MKPKEIVFDREIEVKSGGKEYSRSNAFTRSCDHRRVIRDEPVKKEKIKLTVRRLLLGNVSK